MSRETYAKGQVIPIIYVDELYPDRYYVRGHMPPLVARQTLERYYGHRKTDNPEDNLPPGLPIPIYARWECCIDDDGNPCQGFADHALPGRGKFPVMCLMRFPEETIPA